MVVGILRIGIDIPWSQSLKDKRAVIRSLKSRIEARFKVSVAEIGNLDTLQHGQLGVACITNDSRQADEVLGHVASFALANPGDGSVTSYETEILHLG